MGKQIASCQVTKADRPEDVGAVLELFLTMGITPDHPKTITAVFGQAGQRVLIPATKAGFSPDNSALNVQFSFWSTTILRADRSVASLNVFLAPSQEMECWAQW